MTHNCRYAKCIIRILVLKYIRSIVTNFYDHITYLVYSITLNLLAIFGATPSIEVRLTYQTNIVVQNNSLSAVSMVVGCALVHDAAGHHPSARASLDDGGGGLS